MIEVINLSKTFKKIEAVKSVSFTVNKGEIVGLLGENGAGKTTTLRMLATMLKPTGGTAKIKGCDIIEEPQKVRGEIGILFGGEVGLYDRLSGRENIEYFANLSGMDKKDIKERVNYLVDVLEMGEYIDRRVGKYSRGMKQRIAIARSIVHNPSVMLFDEPTIGLDVRATRIVRDFITSCKKENKAILFSSHSMYEIEKLCDRVVIIHKGNILEYGTLEELKDKYKNKDLEDIFVGMVGEEDEE